MPAKKKLPAAAEVCTEMKRKDGHEALMSHKFLLVQTIMLSGIRVAYTTGPI
jgi:hypothetical protein